MQKILFQGDSLTHAHRRPEAINLAFQLGGGYACMAAARLGRDFPANDWGFVNRGECGDCVSDLLGRWEADALSHAPDGLSVLVGINDTNKEMRGGGGVSDAEFAAAYRRLLDGFASPPVAFLLEPFLLEAGEVTPEWREHLRPRQESIRQIAAETGHVFIPLQECFDQAARTAPASYWLFDGVHATHAGFQLITDAWLEAFTKRFPQFSASTPHSETAPLVAA